MMLCFHIKRDYRCWMMRRKKHQQLLFADFSFQLLAITFVICSALLLLITPTVGANSQQRKDQKKADPKTKIESKKHFNLSAIQHNALSGLLVTPELQSHQYLRPGRITDEQRLMEKLFNGYDRLARPVVNLSDAVTISMSLTITQIFELDEKNQVLITNAWANLEWNDQYMRWDPEQYSGLQMVRILSSKLWLPDIVLYNNAADFSPNVLETRAMVSSNGNIFWSVPTKLFSSCKIDVTYFPFDEQKCRMKFGSWTYDGFKVDLINSSTTADLSLYMKSGEWDLLSADQKQNVVIYTCCIEPYPDVTFYLHIRRKPLYYIINVFIPCLLMSALTLLVFLLPAESGEKCGLGITIMLSFAVFMLTVIEKLPDTSESFPLISVYLTVVMSTTAISIIITVSLLNLNHKSSRSAPVRPWLRHLLDSMSPLCCITIRSPTGDELKCDGSSSDSIGSYKNDVEKPDVYEANEDIQNEDDDFFNNNKHQAIIVDDYDLRQQLKHPEASLRKRHGSITSSTSDTSTSTRASDKALSPVELLRLLTFELNETARASIDSGNSLGPTYHEVAYGLHRLLDREQNEAEVQESAATWRRLAQLIDRILFWVLLFAVTFFTVFILVIAPSLKLL